MKLDTHFETCFDESYADTDQKQNALYRKSQAAHWDADVRIDWTETIDFENPLGYDDRFIPIWGTKQWTEASSVGRADIRRNYHAYAVSQFLHGEQAAMIAAARLVEVLPDTRTKQFAASQACDEARHVEIFDRLLKEKIGLFYPIDDGLKSLIEQGLGDSRWDMVVLTTQILIEGLALAALQQLRDFSKHKLISDIGAYVLADEARHVAFGVHTLKTHYKEMTDVELTKRHVFIHGGMEVLSQRLNPQVIWGAHAMSPNLRVLKKHLMRKTMQLTDQIFPRLIANDLDNVWDSG